MMLITLMYSFVAETLLILVPAVVCCSECPVTTHHSPVCSTFHTSGDCSWMGTSYFHVVAYWISLWVHSCVIICVHTGVCANVPACVHVTSVQQIVGWFRHRWIVEERTKKQNICVCMCNAVSLIQGVSVFASVSYTHLTLPTNVQV